MDGASRKTIVCARGASQCVHFRLYQLLAARASATAGSLTTTHRARRPGTKNSTPNTRAYPSQARQAAYRARRCAASMPSPECRGCPRSSEPRRAPRPPKKSAKARPRREVSNPRPAPRRSSRSPPHLPGNRPLPHAKNSKYKRPRTEKKPKQTRKPPESGRPHVGRPWKTARRTTETVSSTDLEHDRRGHEQACDRGQWVGQGRQEWRAGVARSPSLAKCLHFERKSRQDAESSDPYSYIWRDVACNEGQSSRWVLK